MKVHVPLNTDVMTSPTTDQISAWFDADPDPDTHAELADLVERDPEAAAQRFESRLKFGTAGLRGPLGAGPDHMNRVIVRMAAWALGTRLLADHPDGLVVVGFDARSKSRDFATDTARVLINLGLAVEVLDDVVPTPVLAHSVIDCGAIAGVMVTASHNPPSDSGYKVYWGDGAQIIPPIDRDIERLISSRDPLSEAELADESVSLLVSARGRIDAYLDTVVAALPGAGTTPVHSVYTPLHGVGGQTVLDAFQRRALVAPTLVADQFEPDGDFPTLSLPNPEEDGVLDLAFTTADVAGCDLILANDPDADRLGVAIRRDGRWRTLTGDEIGTLLGDHLLRSGSGPGRVVACSFVSSTALDRVAAHHGVQMRRTLSGFKWIIRPSIEEPDLEYVFGYEEALGFAASPLVRDKDGITAAVVLTELASSLATGGSDLVDRLDEIALRDGLVMTRPVSVRYEHDIAAVTTLMAELRDVPPTTISSHPVVVDDWLTHADPVDLVTLDLGAAGQVLIRPSGTEPKIKAYIEVAIDDVTDIEAARATLSARLDAIATAVDELLTR